MANPVALDYSSPVALAESSRPSPIRWAVGGMLFLAAILNYIDRQTLSILAPTIQADLKLTDLQYGRIANLFLVAYLIATLLSGRLIDTLGTRLSMAVSGSALPQTRLDGSANTGRTRSASASASRGRGSSSIRSKTRCCWSCSSRLRHQP